MEVTAEVANEIEPRVVVAENSREEEFKADADAVFDDLDYAGPWLEQRLEPPTV